MFLPFDLRENSRKRRHVMKGKRYYLLVLCTILFLFVSGSILAVPGSINYQGKLANPDGTPVSDGTYSVTFRIYNVNTGGNALWSETGSILVNKGIFNAKLPDDPVSNPFPPTLLDNPALYLGIQVGSDSEMTPRQEITSVFYAMKAGDSEALNGRESSEFAPADHEHAGEDITSGIIPEARIPSTIARDSEITWGNLSGIPSGFADGVDNVGITTETDPTVPEYFKDGVTWNEISNRPSGLDDGDDVGITVETDPQVGTNTTGYVPMWSGSALIKGTIYDSGTNIGIGTDSPSRKLTVNGKAYIYDGDATVEVNRYITTYPYGLKYKYGIKSDVTTGSYNTTYGVYARATVGANGGYGVYGSSATGIGVSGIADDAGENTQNYGGHFTALGGKGRGVYGFASKSGAYANYGGYFRAEGDSGYGVYGYSPHHCGVYGYGKDRGVYGYASGTNGTGVRGYSSGSSGIGVYAHCYGGTGIYAYSHDGWAGDFRGNVRIREASTGDTVMELGKGLDYAEGFDVSHVSKIKPGSVLVIDPENPGKLKLSDTPYDTKVAGIVAGANGLGSGVRLGAGQYDHPVALAGRVYCYVDATESEVRPGDMLTTSATYGYAMKVTDHNRAHGAVLGKAMEALEKGKKGKILVLVTLQ